MHCSFPSKCIIRLFVKMYNLFFNIFKIYLDGVQATPINGEFQIALICTERSKQVNFNKFYFLAESNVISCGNQ